MKKALSILLAALTASMSFTAFAFEAEPVESAAEFGSKSTADAELQGVSNWLKPGLNAFNETTEPEDFDDWTALSDSVINTSGFYFGTIAGDDSGNKVIYMRGTTPSSGQAYPYGTLSAKLENGRKYRIAFDYNFPAPTNVSNCFWFMYSGASSNNVWKSYGEACCGKTGRYDETLTAPTPASGASDVLNFQFNLYNKDPGTLWQFNFDNFLIMPYYKINYYDRHGVLDHTEQVLLDGDGNVLTSYTPNGTLAYGASDDGKAYDFVGWNTANGASAAMTSVPLSNADIDLYPVYEASDEVYFSATALYVTANNGNTATVTAEKELNGALTVDDGLTDIPYVINDDTVTFTCEGYSGVVGVTGTFTDGTTTTISINFVGGGKWKPGLNTATGTTEPFDLELPEGYALSSFLSSSSNISVWHLDANPKFEAANRSAKAIYVSSTFDYVYQKNAFSPAMEPDRKIRFDYDQFSNVGGYIMNSQPGLQWGNINSTGGGWQHYTKTVSGNPYTNRQSGSQNTSYIGIGAGSAANAYANGGGYFYIDNLSYIPYYRIDYYDLDGETILNTVYALPENGVYTVDASYLPTGAKGFCLEPNTESVTEVALAYEDIKLYATTGVFATFSDGTQSKRVAYTGTVPTFAAAGFTGDNFICWIGSDNKHYYAGDAIESALYETLTFTAYIDDASEPAMGLVYEGDTAATASKYQYSEVIDLGGNKVFHLRQYASTYDSNKGWLYDARIHVRTSTAIDPAKYNVFQYRFALNDGYNAPTNTPLASLDRATDLTKKTSADCIIYFYTGTGGDTYYNGGEHRVGNKVWSFNIDGKFQQIEVDMSNPANAPTATPWNWTGNIYGFAIDPLRANFSGDTYIDSIRLYKGGKLNVTYMNGDEVAFVESGRGAGKGYVLSCVEAEAPAGKTFIGWSLTEDGSVVKTIDLARDAVVYAVFEDSEGTPVTPAGSVTFKTADEVGGIGGLRVASTVSDEQYNAAEEFGFLVSRKVVTGDELTFNTLYPSYFGQNKGSVPYIVGKAYDKSEGIEKLWEIADNGDVTFSGVVYGIPAGHQADIFVMRPYIKYVVNGTEKTFYGTAVNAAVADFDN